MDKPHSGEAHEEGNVPPEGPETKPTEERATSEKQEKYQEETKVNGIEIRVGWAQFEGEYTVAFPQTMNKDGSMKPEFEKAGIYAPDVRTASQDSKFAKKVFDYAVSAAYRETDLVKLIKQVDNYVGQLLSEGETKDRPENA